MTLNIETLRDGEKALDNAPKAALADGRFCIPQHYLSYQHTLQSVEQILLDIDFDPRYPIFVSQEVSNNDASIYIQVGVIGTDNYTAENTAGEKIVYGRKWRVEPQLPTSEIIQTVFLALKKAREHEIRELFRLELQDKNTTPFNNHHDLPLLTNSREHLQLKKDSNSEQHQAKFKNEVEQVLSSVCYGGVSFELMDFMLRPTGEYLADLKIIQSDSHSLTELKDSQFISLFITDLNINYLLHQLMQQLIQLSDRYVDENFYYRNFNRFSWDNSIQAIAQLSCDVRQLHKSVDAQDFALHWQQNNYETDRSRIPVVAPGKLWHKLKSQLEPFSPIESTLPIRSSY
jgi:hypothetical protein